MTTVVAIVPAKDRQDTIADTVEALVGVAHIDRVLVVDDGSTDATTARARAAGAQVLRIARNKGKGGAVAAGVAAAPDADVFVLIDADVGADAVHANVLLEPVLADEADLTIGVLPAAGRRGGFGTIRRFSSWGIRRASGFEATAPLSGQRAVRAAHLRSLTGAGRFGLEVAMTIDAARDGARLLEVEVPMEHLHTGRTVAGFRHRGAQGLDIVAALWPRLVGRFARRSLLAVALVAFIVLSFAASAFGSVSSVPASRQAKKVVIVGVPHLGMDDLDPVEMPNLDRLARQGASGALSVHTGGGSSSAAAYATLGSGFPVQSRDAFALAANRDEIVEGDPAIDVLGRRIGHRPPGHVVVPSMPSARRAAGDHVDSKPGALASALHLAKRRTAVVANSDTIGPDGLVVRRAPSALAIASSSGGIDEGDVNHDLVRSDAAAPFGLVVDDAAFLGAVDHALDRADVVVIDPGETDRASDYAATMVPAAATTSMQAALTRTDALIGQIRARLAPDTMLIVAGMSPPTSKPELVPIVVWGAGTVPGHLSSPSTNRPDLVTLTDLAPTVLANLGIAVPAQMIGQPLRFRPGTVDRSALRAQNDLVTARDQVYPGFLNAFVDIQIVLYLIAAIALLRQDTPASVKRFLTWALLTVAAVPVMTFLVRAVPPLNLLGVGTNVLVWALAGALALGLDRRWRTALDPLVVVAALSLFVLCVDLAFGAHLQVASLLGYTPTVAARFVGIGNAAYAVLGASAVIVACGLVARSDRPRDAWWAAATVSAIAVVADGAPWLGSDVGGILSLVPALGIVLFLLAGRRLSWKAVSIAALATVAALGLVIGYEALQAPQHRDHIGRFFLGGSGGGTFWTTIGRKLATNFSVLTSSTWSHLLPVIGAFMVAILVVGRGWRRLMPAGSVTRIGFIGLLAVAVLGYLANDSGALVASLVFVFMGPYVALVALDGPPVPDELLEPEHAPTSEVSA